MERQKKNTIHKRQPATKKLGVEKGVCTVCCRVSVCLACYDRARNNNNVVVCSRAVSSYILPACVLSLVLACSTLPHDASLLVIILGRGMGFLCFASLVTF